MGDQVCKGAIRRRIETKRPHLASADGVGSIVHFVHFLVAQICQCRHTRGMPHFPPQFFCLYTMNCLFTSSIVQSLQKVTRISHILNRIQFAVDTQQQQQQHQHRHHRRLCHAIIISNSSHQSIHHDGHLLLVTLSLGSRQVLEGLRVCLFQASSHHTTTMSTC